MYVSCSKSIQKKYTYKRESNRECPCDLLVIYDVTCCGGGESFVFFTDTTRQVQFVPVLLVGVNRV